MPELNNPVPELNFLGSGKIVHIDSGKTTSCSDLDLPVGASIGFSQAEVARLLILYPDPEK